jgi:hypothetical protein
MENSFIVSLLGGGTTGMVVGIVYIVYKCIKKSSCRSNCCGVRSSISIDLEKGLNSDSPNTSKKELVI